MSVPIADLHCDLLSFLAGDEQRSPLDPEVHCSLPQLQAGQVRFQALAIGYETKEGSAALGMRQAQCFLKLLEEHSQEVVAVEGPEEFKGVLKGERIGLILAIENASAFSEEKEPLRTGLKRLQELALKVCRPLYISLTWNHENRFGGGALTDVGLKKDGKTLLDFLDGRQIAVDFSHTSDRLAHDILNYVSAHDLDIAVLASHSNVREVKDVPRNLPNDLLQEIIRRRGLVGLNFVRGFVGSHPEEFARHVEAVVALGGEDNICLGADFFYDGATSTIPGKEPQGWYFPEYSDAGCYGRLLDLLKQKLALSEAMIEKLAYGNACAFFSRLRQTEALMF